MGVYPHACPLILSVSKEMSGEMDGYRRNSRSFRLYSQASLCQDRACRKCPQELSLSP